MICTWYLALLPLVIFQNCLKFHSLNGSWNYVKQFSNITCGLLCQISLQIMLLPIQILKCCKPSCNLAINILVNSCGGFFNLRAIFYRTKSSWRNFYVMCFFFVVVVLFFNRPFYRYVGHIEWLIRFKEYYGMPRGAWARSVIDRFHCYATKK